MLATMLSMSPVAETYGDIVDRLTDEERNGITSLNDLAQRLHELDSRQKASSWRTTIKRARRADGNPTEKTIKLTAEAFGVPRSQFPSSRQRSTVAQLQDRLEEGEGRAERDRGALWANLVAIDTRLSRIEQQLGIPEQPDSAGLVELPQ